jgi:hypothetical protein
MESFSFANYFGEINMLADLQFMPGEKPFIDRPSASFEPKEMLLYLGCNVLRTAHLAVTAIQVLKAMGFESMPPADRRTAAALSITSTTIHRDRGTLPQTACGTSQSMARKRS